MLAIVIEEATKTLNGKDAASYWLRFHTHSFGGRPAVALLDSIHGLEIVRDTLGRIEHGIPS